jgi:hypothetical protein
MVSVRSFALASFVQASGVPLQEVELIGPGNTPVYWYGDEARPLIWRYQEASNIVNSAVDAARSAMKGGAR